MYAQVARNIVVTTSETVTQAVALGEASAAMWDVTVSAIGGNVTNKLQGSNDLENWKDIATGTAISGTGYQVSSLQTSIIYAYVRVSLVGASGTAVMAVGINAVEN